MKRITLILAALAVLLAARTNLHAIPPPTYGKGNRTPSSPCPSADGSSHLDPKDVMLLPPPQAGQGVLATLGNGRFPGWTFNAGPALNGTMVINYYYSKFWSPHFSGARIDAVYTPGPGDPATLRWVQLVNTTSPSDGTKTRIYIDQDPESTANPPLPFYYDEAKAKKMTVVEFKDQSRRHHPPTSSASWQGSFYLVSWDGATPGVVTVHDGIMWGWMGECDTAGVKTMSLTVSNGQGDGAVITCQSNSLGTNLPPVRTQSTTDLKNPAWTDRTNGITLSNGVYRVVLPVAQPQEYFRFALDTTPLTPDPVGAYVADASGSNIVAQSHEAFMYCRADGTLPIGYQWLFNGIPIANATNGILDFQQAQSTNQGYYTVLVGNAYGTDQSDPAYLQVVPDTTPPALVSAAATSNRLQIVVAFSEAVNPSTALNPANYQVHSVSPPGTVPIFNAIQGSDQSIVILNPSGQLPANSQFYLQASQNISDLATPPNYLPSGSQTTFNTGP
jgi:hypothetical protein